MPAEPHGSRCLASRQSFLLVQMLQAVVDFRQHDELLGEVFCALLQNAALPLGAEKLLPGLGMLSPFVAQALD